MSPTYSVLIIGCGAIAGGYDTERPVGTWPLTHAGAFQRHGGFRLAACVDIDFERCESFAQRWAVGSACRDMQAAASEAPYDIVSICSPTAMHAEHIEAALALGPQLIFCEKPITADLGDAGRLIDACEAAGVRLAVNLTRRWAPDVVRIRDDLATGRWGRVRAANAVYNKGVLHNGVHLVDLLRFLVGPLSLVAAGAPVFDFLDSDPTVPAILATEEGVTITLGIAHAADYSVFELEIVAERAVLTMEGGGSKWRIRCPVDSQHFPGFRVLDEGTVVMGEYDRAPANAVAEIHDALWKGESLSSTGRSAFEAQALCSLIRDAALLGRG
jgi:predicted dehydrogenase